METKNTQPSFPWYKERLQTKYLTATTNKISSVGNCCRFVNLSLDDFSDCSSVLSRAQRGPIVFHGTPNLNSSQKPRKCISKEHACFSKQMVQKQIRREYVAAVEKKLKQHPLAMYPHYKDHITPELFDKVVSVLDPDMSAKSASALPNPPGGHAEEKDGQSEEDMDTAKHETLTNKISSDVQTPTPSNAYILQRNGNGIKKGRTVKVRQQSSHGDVKVAAKTLSQ